jgi:hypothetical protein
MEMRNVNKILVGKPEGKRSVRRIRWEKNLEMYLKEIWCEGMDWIHLAQRRDQ